MLHRILARSITSHQIKVTINLNTFTILLNSVNYRIFSLFSARFGVFAKHIQKLQCFEIILLSTGMQQQLLQL